MSIKSCVIVDDGNNFVAADPELLTWTAITRPTSVDWSDVTSMFPEIRKKLSTLAPGAGPSWERVLQDLHSGRLFGAAGIFLIDLTGVIILLLAISGFVTIIMRKRRT